MPSAAILAGGHARRFGGRDKSALVVTGEGLDARGDRNRLLANIDTLAEYEELEALRDHHR